VERIAVLQGKDWITESRFHEVRHIQPPPHYIDRYVPFALFRIDSEFRTLLEEGDPDTIRMMDDIVDKDPSILYSEFKYDLIQTMLNDTRLVDSVMIELTDQHNIDADHGLEDFLGDYYEDVEHNLTIDLHKFYDNLGNNIWEFEFRGGYLEGDKMQIEIKFPDFTSNDLREYDYLAEEFKKSRNN